MSRSPRVQTPVVNRILFGIIAAFLIAGFLEMVYHRFLGHGELPYLFWVALFAFPIIGFVLTAAKGDIRFRLHKVLTPVGITMIIFVLLTFYFLDAPGYNGVLDAFLHNTSSTEAIPYVVGFGLFLAFVDLKAVYKYAYYFLSLAVFNFFGLFLYAIMYIPSIISGSGGDFEAIIDVMWFMSGFIFVYYILKRFKAQRPSYKQIIFGALEFIAVIVVLVIVGYAIAGLLPANNWFAQWVSFNQ